MIAHQLKKQREKNGFSQAELGRRLGVGQSTVAMWESGRNNPEYGTLLKLADIFGVGIDVLAGGLTATGGITIPVLGRVQAGVPITAVEDIIGYEDISAEMRRHGEYFALVIRGDSMEPRICEGDVVIVRRQNVVDNGEISIVLVGNEDATCKRFYKHKDGISLVSLNPQYEPMFFSNEELRNTKIKILGKVTELRARL